MLRCCYSRWKVLVVPVMLLIVLARGVCADAPIWKVSKGDKIIYLGGTVHILTEDDYPLPEAFEAAYTAADLLVLETDLQALQKPAFQKTLSDTVVYPDGTTIVDKIKTQTYKQLLEYLKSRGIQSQQVTHFKPGMLSATITMIELRYRGLHGEGVDAFFSRRAVLDEKPLLYLESVEDQLGFLSRMGEGNEDEVIRYTLNELDQLPQFFQLMKSAWRSGDHRQLEKIALNNWEKNFPDVYYQLLLARNHNWIRPIEKMLKTPETELVLVGALHLIGKDSLINLLKGRGYKIKPYRKKNKRFFNQSK